MAVFFYLFISFYLGRKNSFFYLIFPIALQQGAAAFIDQSVSVGGKRIFSVYDTVFNDFLFFIVLIISLFLLKIKFPKLDFFGSKFIIFYFIYLLMLFLVDIITYRDTGEVLLTARSFLYNPIVYILWLAIFSSVTRRQYEKFLSLIFYITPLSAILYILNSSNIVTLFPRELVYLEIEMTPTNAFRDFATIPIFLIPVLVTCFQSLLMPVFKIPKFLVYVNLIILPIALLFTFTRSLLLMVLIQILIMIALNCFKGGAKGFRQAFSFAFLFILFSIPIYLTAQKLFPTQIEYYVGRFSNVSDEGLKEQNVDIRVLYLKKTMQVTSYTSPAFGAGMNREYYPELNEVGAWTADSTIPYFLYHTGWVGVAFLYLILVGFSIDSIFFYIKTGDWLVAYLASNFLTLTIASLIMGGHNLNGSVWGFMNFALYAIVKFNLWKRPVVFIPLNYFKLKNSLHFESSISN